MKVLNKITLDKKSIKELVYQGINYAFWYYAYTLPILYTRGYQESLEEIGISMEERKAYTQNMHEILGRMPFDELMKQSPRYAFKNTFGKNPFRDIILWANETGYEYDNYQNNIIKEYIDTKGELDIQKLYENYKQKLEPNYTKQFENFINSKLEEYSIYNTMENKALLNCFKRSCKLITNENYCLYVNRVFEENQVCATNEVMLVNSYIYREDYRIENYQSKLTTSPEKYFESLDYKGDFNKANFTYACIDNFEKTKEYYNEIVSVSIRGKNYILESLSSIEEDHLIQELCKKKFVPVVSIENRAYEHQIMSINVMSAHIVTYEEVINYRKEMNNESIEQNNIG